MLMKDRKEENLIFENKELYANFQNEKVARVVEEAIQEEEGDIDINQGTTRCRERLVIEEDS